MTRFTSTGGFFLMLIAGGCSSKGNAPAPTIVQVDIHGTGLLGSSRWLIRHDCSALCPRVNTAGVDGSVAAASCASLFSVIAWDTLPMPPITQTACVADDGEDVSVTNDSGTVWIARICPGSSGQYGDIYRAIGDASGQCAVK